MITKTSLTQAFTAKILNAMREAQEDYLMVNPRDRAIIQGGRSLVMNRKGNASIRVTYKRGRYQVIDMTVKGGHDISSMVADRLPAMRGRMYAG